jgi:hypothetical protein
VPLDLVILPSGVVRCIYGEQIELNSLGAPTISRGSHVEPDADGHWTANLAPVGGPVLGPFARRSTALAAEQLWLAENWLLHPSAHAADG